MGEFENAGKLGLRDKETNKVLAVYPYKAEGTDAEINKIVRDWYYQQNCAAEDQLLTAYVDILTEQEIVSRKKFKG
ncbi:hypothetical protein E4K67_05695 [Desulfosporosinus fructosivorans]|uniref:Uncharacterized protein n=1 Tax=Desulfosporosinus fructosivorans TaxID=2018669 RepID=A0A4Z0R929_9FIRM|nr:hypothetical protein [Desulfosporosinus fructosivorans]TGE38964.1 hypothetical protein E4K67_05695 [Desulfosporosinus fructosivorans]